MDTFTFVTESHLSGDEKAMVDILSLDDVESIADAAVESALASVEARLSRGLERTSKMAAEAKKEAGAAKKAAAAAEKGTESMAQRLAGEAGETFRNVVEESLAPVFRTGLAEALETLKDIQKEHKELQTAFAKLRKELAAAEKRMAGLEQENKHLRKSIGKPSTEDEAERTEDFSKKKKATSTRSTSRTKGGEGRVRKKDGSRQDAVGTPSSAPAEKKTDVPGKKKKVGQPRAASTAKTGKGRPRKKGEGK